MKTKKWLIGCVMVLTCAYAGGLIYADGKFHYPYIKIWDFARGLEYMADSPSLRSAYDFLAAHIDVVESFCDDGIYSNVKSLALKQRNPNIRTFKYELDMTQVQNQNDTHPLAASEEMYLHFSDTTTYTLNGHSITIPGCSDLAHPTKNSRMQTYIWTTYRWILNQQSQAFREAMANHLNTAADLTSADGIFLDEHGPGMEANGLNPAAITSGGHVLEYGKKHISKIGAENNADLAASLAYYKQELNKHNKFLVINGAMWSAGDPLVIAQIKAAGGTVTEFMVRPTVGDGGPNFENMLKGLDESIATGAMIDLLGNNGQAETAGLTNWTPGNYSTGGANRIWIMNNTAYVRSETLPAVADLYWKIEN